MKPDRVPEEAPPEVEGKKRDAERTRGRIVDAARLEFSERGFAGTRLDAIAQAAGIDKRLIYYYFKNKETLFLQVLEADLGAMREAESNLRLDDLEPTEAIRRMVQFYWDWLVTHPEQVRLVAAENLCRAKHLAHSKLMPQLSDPLIQRAARALERGRAAGVFRGGVDPLQLHLSITAMVYYYVSNQHTLGVLFKKDMMTPRAKAERLIHITDVILGYLLKG